MELELELELIRLGFLFESEEEEEEDSVSEEGLCSLLLLIIGDFRGEKTDDFGFWGFCLVLLLYNSHL